MLNQELKRELKKIMLEDYGLSLDMAQTRGLAEFLVSWFETMAWVSKVGDKQTTGDIYEIRKNL